MPNSLRTLRTPERVSADSGGDFGLAESRTVEAASWKYPERVCY